MIKHSLRPIVWIGLGVLVGLLVFASRQPPMHCLNMLPAPASRAPPAT